MATTSTYRMRWFDELCRAQRADLEPVDPSMSAWLRDLDALYLYGTIGSEAVLLRDGTVRMWRADEWPESDEYTERVATPKERIGSVVLGARRMPELRELLPTRVPGVPDCAACGGTGEWPHATGVLCPECDGLGWVGPAI